MTTDIVQLKEKGKPVYLKTHTAAIDGLESYIKKIDADKAYQKLPKKNRCGQVHGMAELQEMGKYLLSLFHSVRMVGFYNGKNIPKKEL